MAMPSSVFTRVTASAPASCTAAATSTTRSVLGLSFAQRGRPHLAAASIAAALATGSWAISAPPDLGVGTRQVDLDRDDLGGQSASSSAARA